MSILLAALLAASGVSPDSVIGTWHSPKKNGIIRIEKCGSSICGALEGGDDIRANPAVTDSKNSDASLRNRPLKGLRMLSGFSWSDGAWTGGSVYDPTRGKTFSGKITPVDANTLSLRGCIFVPLCQTDTWTRVR